MLRQATFQTFMPADAEILFNFGSANTSLARSSCIDFNQLATGAFCLVHQFFGERRPRDIVNLFSKHSTTQPFNVQLLDRDQVVLTNQVCRKFVLKVVSFIGNRLIDTAKLGDGLSAAVRSFLTSRNPSLRDPHFLSSRLKIFPVINLRSVRESRERFDTYINPDRLTSRRQDGFWHINTRDNREPFRAFAFSCDLFDCAFDRSREFDFQIPNEREIQPRTAQSESTSVVDDRIKTGVRLEARESSLLLEEWSKRLVELTESLFHRATLHGHVIGIVRANSGDLFDLIEARNAHSVQSPCLFPFCKSSIVKITQKVERFIQALALSFVWINAALVRPSHNSNYSAFMDRYGGEKEDGRDYEIGTGDTAL